MIVVALPNRREIDTLHALKDRGWSISTVRGKTRSLNVAREIPTLTNVVKLPARLTSNPFGGPRVQDIFDFARRPQ